MLAVSTEGLLEVPERSSATRCALDLRVEPVPRAQGPEQPPHNHRALAHEDRIKQHETLEPFWGTHGRTQGHDGTHGMSHGDDLLRAALVEEPKKIVGERVPGIHGLRARSGPEWPLLHRPNTVLGRKCGEERQVALGWIAVGMQKDQVPA